jgi:hypothetical protein
VTLAALPIDAAWHAAFGRDAVLWSPPHMLAVFGSLALLVGFLASARPDTPTWILTGLRALLPVIGKKGVHRPIGNQVTAPARRVQLVVGWVA